ncbi:MAG: hypothetical protein HQM15_10385 [Deltaproteobacteria bacterium]|nr:hypothetical protein [Deltaproteobacteria bacterium]
MKLLKIILPFIFLLFPSSLHALEQKGMALGLFSKEANYSYLNDLQEMKKLGVTHTLLIVSWYQKDIKANEIGPREYDGKDILTLSDDKLREVIHQAHEAGIEVTLFPILRLENRNGNDWRGVIAPENLELWWENYERFILHYAQIAAQEKAWSFSVGSELLSREKETEQWTKLIKKVRETFSGKLLYSGNWDHYQHPHFWKDLDYIGVTAYYEISKTKKPSLKMLTRNWRKIKRELLAWKKKYPRQKLVITEVGYPSIDGSSMHPWNYFLEGKVDIKEQALCYRAFVNTWKNTKSLSGVYFWVWWGEGGKKDKSYSPRNKPAARYLKQWYLR